MKIENTKVYNFDSSFRGCRNPKNSWDRSDSIFNYHSFNSEDVMNKVNKVADSYNDKKKAKLVLICDGLDHFDNGDNCLNLIGKNDLTLALSLIKAGSEHRKFLRQIFISADITAPIYIWKEVDQYRIGVTTNSCSTMHKLASSPITIDNFETDDWYHSISGEFFEKTLIPYLENLRQAYNTTQDKRYWKELIRLLPQGFLQKRTITMSYENAYNIYFQRHNHKLNEWSGIDQYLIDQEYGEGREPLNICEWIASLPYMALFLGIDTLE